MSIKVLTLLLMTLKSGFPATEAHRWAKWMHESAEANAISAVLVVSVMWYESRLKPRVMSRKCAVGLGQVLVPGCDRKAVKRLKDPRYNIVQTVKIMAQKRHGCRSGRYKRRYCTPHWVQAYNPRSRTYVGNTMLVFEIVNRMSRRIALDLEQGHLTDPLRRL